MGVLRRLRMMERLWSLCRDSCLVPCPAWGAVFRRWSAGLSLSFSVRGWSCGPLLEADASVKSKPALHGKKTVARQEAQKHQPWVTHNVVMERDTKDIKDTRIRTYGIYRRYEDGRHRFFPPPSSLVLVDGTGRDDLYASDEHLWALCVSGDSYGWRGR